MEITDVRIKLMADNDDRLQAFCSITLDSEFVVRDLKIIDGNNGVFVAMPSRKLTTRCANCCDKNDVGAQYCSRCGAKLSAERSADNRPRIFTDIAHPINASCRHKIQTAVVRALEEERIRAKAADYVCHYDDNEGAAAVRD